MQHAHPQFPFVQRWRDGRSAYRPAREVVDTANLDVTPLDERAAREFVVRHHYSRSYPAARVRAGLFRRAPFARPALVGVAVFSVPMNAATTQKHLGLDLQEAVELGRFVLLDDVGANAETWFLARAFRLLHAEKPAVRGVIAFSDPMPRQTIDGAVVMPGHIGTIYQASNATYLGRSSKRTLILADDGRCVSSRALAKLRNGESGADYAYKQLLDMGAPRRHADEDADAYVRRATGCMRRMNHPGNHAYGWTFDDTLSPNPSSFPKGREVRAVPRRSSPENAPVPPGLSDNPRT